MKQEFAPDHLAVVTDTNTKLFHGAFYRNHPTPSGCDRYYLETTTTEGYKTQLEAAIAIEKHYPSMENISKSIAKKAQLSEPKVE